MSESDGAGAPLWAGRFSKPPAEAAEALGASLHFDARLAEVDIASSVAHVRALEDAGLLTEDEADQLEKALLELDLDAAITAAEAEGALPEDVHLLIETALTAQLGDLGAKLHAGRSRNDLVVTDTRLWLLETSADIADGVEGLVMVLASRAEETAELVMPGFTHNRAAQVVTAGYVLAAHGFALLRDLERLDDWAERTAVSGLGAGATATSTLGLDPAATAERLGFARAFDNALDAVADRDFSLEFLSVASILAVHLSRLAADVARWSEPQLGYAQVDDAYATGSSMMPQKRNPDVAELVRGKASRIAGDLVALTGLLAGLPLGYHRDLQEDKEPVFDAADTLRLALPAITGCVATLTFDADAMRRDTNDEGLYATDLAEALVKGGVPFREAHRTTGELLKELAAEGRTLFDLSPDEWSELDLPDGARLLDADASVAARDIAGGPAPVRVREQAGSLRAALAARSRE